MTRIYPTLSPNDITALEKKAKAEGLSVSNYVRKIIREDIRTKKSKPTQWEIDHHKEILFAIRALVSALVNALVLTAPKAPLKAEIDYVRKTVLNRWEEDRK